MTRNRIREITRENAGTPVCTAMVAALHHSVTDGPNEFPEETLQNTRDALVIPNDHQDRRARGASGTGTTLNGRHGGARHQRRPPPDPTRPRVLCGENARYRGTPAAAP
jgi:hypothetical protein